MELGYFDTVTGQEFTGPPAPASTPRDYTLATSIINGVVSITNSVLGVVSAGQAAAAAAPGAPGGVAAPAYLPAQGMSTPGMIAIALPAVVLVALVMTRK